jgi:hypothetical protein
VARRREPLAARVGTAALALLVAALLVSWAWARFRPTRVPSQRDGAPAVVRVQVLNGSGEARVAGQLASFLREGGFRIVEVGNADRDDYFATLVVARREDPAAALEVARYLGSPPVIRQARASGEADVTVLLGSDRSRLHLGP